jgi:hypothetical protein
MPLLTELEWFGVWSYKDAAPTALKNLSRDGCEGGEGFLMDKNFDRSNFNLQCLMKNMNFCHPFCSRLPAWAD